MKLQETIEESIKNYPALFPERVAVLDHLFCSYGNGYDWVDGELVNIFPEEAVRDERDAVWEDQGKKFVDEMGEKANEPVLKEYIQETLEYFKHLSEEYRTIRNEYKKRADRHYSLGTYKEWCPMCEYSGLVNFPDDIKPDWAVGVKEVANKILALSEEEWNKSVYGDWDEMQSHADYALIRLEELDAENYG